MLKEIGPNQRKPDYRDKRNFVRMRLAKNRKAVSEALGTILLLAVAIVLVSAMYVWTETIPKLDEGKTVNFIARYEDGNVTIKHMGGDVLLDDDIDINIALNGISTTYNLTDSKIGDDGIWLAGETWSLPVAVTSQDELEVMVVDTKNQMVIFNDELYTTAVTLILADLSIKPENITFNFPGNQIRRGIWTNITIKVANLGVVDVKDAVVRVFAGSTLIMKGTEGHQVVDIAAKSSVSVWVNWTPQAFGVETIFVKVYSGFNELDYSNNFALKQVLIDIPSIFVHGPDLQFTQWDILMYPENPTRGDDVKLTLVVHNLGDEAVFSNEGATLLIRDTPISWNTTTDKADYTDGKFLNEMFFNISVPANGVIQKELLWEARPGGNVTIYAYIDANNSVIETEETGGALEFNNLAFRSFKILPKILLVDDDNVTAGEYDSGASLRNAMIAAGASFDMYFVSGFGDPQYDFGSRQIKDYDIIVWTTGYEDENTLTPANIETMKRAAANGTYFWIVGQDILPELSAREGDADGDPDPGEFVYDYLGIDNFTLALNGAPEILEGIAGDPISNDLKLNLSSINLAEDRAINISKFKSDSPTDRLRGNFYNRSSLGGDGNMTTSYYNISEDFKSIYFGFDFSAITNTVTKAQVAYKALRYLNWTLTFGLDFAVAEETFSKAEPRYLDRVWINATILNNGPSDENVTVAFYVTGPDGQERLIQPYPDFQKNPFPVDIPGGGSMLHVSKVWLATDVGLHDFRVVVDPFDAHAEISEENNDITYSDLVTELDVAFAILVVDDDNSTNNLGSDVDVATSITESLDLLGYDYDVHVVPGGVTGFAGPDVDIMKHYNAVFWATGTASNSTLNETDQEEVEYYLDGVYEEASFIPNLRVNFFLMGSNVLEDLNGSGTVDLPAWTFLERFIKIDRYTTDVPIAGKLHGIYKHPLSHGMDYRLDLTTPAGAADPTTDVVVPGPSARGLFWLHDYQTDYSGISYNGSDYRMVFLPWSMSMIGASNHSTETNQSEFMFLLLNWFGYPEKRIELRTYTVDIDISDDNPVIGDSYVVRTNVYNYGGEPTSAIVRYYDKDTIIATQTIFVPANGNSTSEIIWVPLFAGNRSINVKVDAANDIPEVFEYLNNNASLVNREVYFFYDDMEKGAGNWYHESVIYRIKGESPLDYMDEPVYTMINGTWDEVSGFGNNSEDFHSSSQSFFASEPDTPTSKPILDIIFVFDTSNSMEYVKGVKINWPNRPIDKAKTAARFLLDYVDDESRVAIFKTFNSQGQRNVTLDVEGWVTLDAAGRKTIMGDDPHYLYNTSASNSELNPQADTSIWKTIGEAIQAGVGAGRKGQTVVIALTDGQDFSSADHQISDPPSNQDYSKVEMESMEWASYGWCPWTNYYDIGKFNTHWGKYFGTTDDPGYWYETDFGGINKDDIARGLLNSPIPVYTIGLSLETATNRSGDISNPAFTYTNSVTPKVSRHADVYIGSGGNHSGTPEFNLFEIANTSGAKYFYAPSGDDLKDIFGKILVELQTLLARSETRATDIGIETKYALTGEFSLVGMDSAKLSFYHKYNLFLGYNGAIVRVGTVNQSGGWEYKYVQPTQLYNSNLYLKRQEIDDFGVPMLWCWNGVSGRGQFDWEYAEFDLSPFIGQSRVRINFTLILYGGGGGGGWWVDDVEVRVSRSNSNPVTDASRDQWEWTDAGAHSGDFAWWNHNATTGHLTGGLDNSLVTRSIDMTKARNATLTAYMRFNINASTGRPPDGFRVEVSSDNGLSWKPINLGVRASWGVSGSENDASDGIGNDGKSFTGLDPDNDKWVEAGTLTRLSVDLSGWRGSVIKLRFRVITSTDDNPFWGGNHYQDGTSGVGGLWIDDVIIYGESIESESETARSEEKKITVNAGEGRDKVEDKGMQYGELGDINAPEHEEPGTDAGPKPAAGPDSEAVSDDAGYVNEAAGSEVVETDADFDITALGAGAGAMFIIFTIIIIIAYTRVRRR